MNLEVEMLLPALALLFVSLVLTGFSLWFAGKLAPWFLEERFEPPSVRSYFLDPTADSVLTRGRVVTVLIATAIMLAVLVAVASVVKFGGLGLL